jgi:CMP-N,N'-diacetyllegionaminic acid synthase
MVALIPARGGSKGIHKKNIKDLAGHPLIAYSIKACLECDLVSDVYVSTDDTEIAKISKHYGAKVPFYRPVEYSQDNSTDNQVINHFFNFWGDETYNDLVFIRPTTPLRDPNLISNCIEHFYQNYDKCSSIRSVHELPESPYKMYRLDKEGYCSGFFDDFNGNKNYSNLPRQVFPKAFHPNGYVDIVKREQTLTLDTFGQKVLPFETNFSLEVDTQDQFELLELDVMKNGNSLLESMNNDKDKK